MLFSIPFTSSYSITDEIKDMEQRINKKIDGVASDLKSFKEEMHEFKGDMNDFREETKKEFNQINVKFSLSVFFSVGTKLKSPMVLPDCFIILLQFYCYFYYKLFYSISKTFY